MVKLITTDLPEMTIVANEINEKATKIIFDILTISTKEKQNL